MVPWVAVEATSIEPRSPPTRRRTIQSPSPSPGKVAASPSPIRYAARSEGRPGPASPISTTSASFSTFARKSTLPPGGLAAQALSSRIQRRLSHAPDGQGQLVEDLVAPFENEILACSFGFDEHAQVVDVGRSEAIAETFWSIGHDRRSDDLADLPEAAVQ